jgi:hypothetical protein
MTVDGTGAAVRDGNCMEVMRVPKWPESSTCSQRNVDT